MPNQLWCQYCGHTWQPRGGGRGYSVKCPSCNARLGDEQFDLMRAQRAAARRNMLIMCAVGLCCCGTCVVPGVIAPFLPTAETVKVAKQPDLKVEPVAKPVIAQHATEPESDPEPPRSPSATVPEQESFIERLNRAKEIPPVDAASTEVPARATGFDEPPAKSKHELRTWHDMSLAHKTEARFVSMTGKKVKLQKATGEVIEIEMGTLSLADQEYVRGLR